MRVFMVRLLSILGALLLLFGLALFVSSMFLDMMPAYRALRADPVWGRVLFRAVYGSFILSSVASLAVIMMVVISRRLYLWKWVLLSSLIFVPAMTLTFVFWFAGRVLDIQDQHGRRAIARVNLVRLYDAVTVYAGQHDGMLPNADRWCDELLVDVNGLDRQSFVLPERDAIGFKGECSFAFNSNLGGRKLADVPPQTILIFLADGPWNLHGTSELTRANTGWAGRIGVVLLANGRLAEYDRYGSFFYRSESAPFVPVRIGNRKEAPWHGPPCWEP